MKTSEIINQSSNSQDENARQIQLLLARIYALENSRSWKITAPVRWLSRRFKTAFFPAIFVIRKVISICGNILSKLFPNYYKSQIQITRQYILQHLSMLPELQTIYPSEFNTFQKTLLTPLIDESFYSPKIGIIVPSYNHAEFLDRRIQSLLTQTYHNIKIYILDDASTDGSINIIKKYAELDERVTYIVNEKRSGSVFKQWAKGLKILQDDNLDVWWICESDDVCNSNFLEIMIPYFKDQSVMLAFGKIDYIDEKDQISNGLEFYRRDSEEVIWDRPVARTAREWFTGSMGAMNLIPNSGGCLIRAQMLSISEIENLQKFTIAGDWYLFSTCMRTGFAIYNNEARAYFRQHSKNTSVIRNNSTEYYEEILAVYKHIAECWGESLNNRRLFLQSVTNHQKAIAQISATDMFPVEQKLAEIKSGKQQKHILITTLGFSLGGAEICAIDIANELIRRNYLVSVLVTSRFSHGELRDRLDSRIPVFTRRHIELIGVNKFLEKLGINIIHSHNIESETIFLQQPFLLENVKYIVTLHGSYEVSTVSQQVVNEWAKYVNAWIYLNDKNLSLIPRKGVNTYYIPNSMPLAKVYDFSRSLDLERAVILTLASRALPEKGWEQAILAVIKVNDILTKRDNVKINVELHLAGVGYEAIRLKNIYGSHKNIKFLGFVSDIHELFCQTDIVLLPTFYPGESMPTVLIQALQAGRPIISTRLASIPMMCKDEIGSAALIIDDYADMDNLIEELSKKILQLLQIEIYQELQKHSYRIGMKYEISSYIEQYIKIYETNADSRRSKSITNMDGIGQY